MQRRDRTCSNPYPARFGDHCYGDSRDDRLCVDAVCPVTDGGWSTWTSWTACTASCGGGIKSHYRDCINPMPSAGGKHCTGLQHEVTACNQNNCPLTDGGWSTWTSWTACTASCGSGIKSHYRDCNNPMPSVGGRLCTGLQHEVTSCNQKNCPRKLSSFSYSHPVMTEIFRYKEKLCHIFSFGSIYTCSTVAFDTKIFEEGSSYNSTTGDFTCSYPGVYVFMASLISSAGSKINCDITKNNHAMAKIIKYSSDSKDSISATITLHLQRGDKISLFCQHFSEILESSSTFSGFLLQSDS
ncbi:semaphorin-5A-like [Ruditapes philippinarum]|uniref:semaphorin-5A-like n=1 Tax=Ruditapes philippinarum TaxID=129788 RepID=UPI00295A5C2C|nr:semaphorin-5A-like [Ruditapes philippinarum]